jgi:hypothetical protein
MKTVQQIIDDTLKIENHDERYLYGRFKGFYRGTSTSVFQWICNS